jgi:hypothetical protein
MRGLGRALTVALVALGLSATTAGAATFEVDTAIDDASKDDCTAAVDDCSLSGAITLANGGDPIDTIGFDIPGAGPHVILLNGDLPVLAQQTTVDGYSETGATANDNPNFTSAFAANGEGSDAVLMIEIDANNHDALRLGGNGNHTVRGLAIHDSDNDGIRVESGGNVIQGNFLGPLANGAQPPNDGFGELDTNNRSGVRVESGAGNLIGGALPAERNLISSNGEPPNSGTGIEVVGGSGTDIQGNLLGTDKAGAAAQGSTFAINVNGFVLNVPTDVTVGGDQPQMGNLISGHTNGGAAVQFNGSGTGYAVLGNRLGTDITGESAVPNNAFAAIRADSDNVAIGNGVDDGNLISGNCCTGIALNGSGHTVEGNAIGTNRSGTTALPNSNGIQLEANNATIGGTDANQRNVISGNLGSGIFSGSNGAGQGSDIQGNYIGTDATGSSAIGNDSGGISLAGGRSVTIGGSAAGAGNVVSGNTRHGVLLQPPEGPENELNEVLGNNIGTAADGTTPLGNEGPGVRVFSGFRNVIGRPGQGNVIANNLGDGVLISGDEFTSGSGLQENDRNSIRGNSISSNGALGIDLGPDEDDFLIEGDGLTANDAGDGDDGANDRQNFPLVNAAQPGSSTFVRGFINAKANTSHTIDLYRTEACDDSGNGEGTTWLGSTTAVTNSFGNALWNATVAPTVPLGEFVTATATDSLGSTSELSPCRESGTAVADPAIAPPPGRKPTPPQGQQPTPPTQRGPSCRDRQPPITTLKRGGLKVRDGKVTLKGRSRDRRACPSGVQKVDVSLARVRGRTGVNCRFIRKRNRYSLTARKNCRRPTLFRATGTRRWNFKFALRLKPGLYRVQARGTDRARNKETPRKRRNIVFFQVR